MVAFIVLGNRLQVQILDVAVFISLHTNAVGKGMAISLLSSIGQTGLFSLDMATGLGEGKLNLIQLFSV